MARKSILLRMQDDLHRELRGWAEHEMRSLNAQIEFLLKQALVQRKGGAPSAAQKKDDSDNPGSR